MNTLPTGGAITYGNATITQNGNTLNINQTSGQAIGSFTTFSIGSNAVVDISQPNAAAAFLARVTGSDPSLIYGLLKSNGTVALINQNGILVGPTGVVDVARFIASTLNISDSDFLAGRLTFNNGATAGSVENQGTIKSATGGSVYLIGANVTNSGVITSPNGEILLAAGQTVQLVDTATPGVSVNVTGSAGSVTNLGTISAAAGRIGIAAGLINNSGNINASSVVSDGGRIFLRASQNLTTTASSNISADGASTGKGGSVVLYSDGAAYIDGDVSAQGAAGKGGYVETSGLKSLDVVKVPTVGSGGQWYIDPYDLEVVSDSFAPNNTTADPVNAISSSGDSSKIRASTIVGLLNGGTDVTLTTGNSGGSDAGNITVSANINKVGASNSNLTLNAQNNISINANITSSGSALNLTLNSYYRGDDSGSHDVNVNHADISLNGGVLTVTNGNSTSHSGNGGLNLNNGSRLLLTQASSGLMAGDVTVDGTSSLLISQGSASVGTFTNSGTANISGSGTINVSGDVNNHNLLNLSGSGNVNISGSINNTDTGTINVDATSLHFNQTNSLNTSGNFNVNGGTLTVQGGNVSGNVNVASGAAFNLNYMNVGNATGATSFTGTGSMAWAGNITLLSDITLAANGPSLTLNGGNPEFVLAYSGQTPRTLITNNTVTVNGRASLDPGVIWNNSGTVNINALNQEGDRLSLGGNAQFNNLQGGTINLTGPTSLIANAGDFNNQAGATLNLGTCSTLDVGSNAKFANAGNITMQVASKILASNAANSGIISGNGTITSSGVFTNSGVVTLGDNGSLTATSFANSLGATVNGTGAVSVSGDFNNNGIVALGTAGSIAAVNFNNNNGGAVNGNGTYTLSDTFNNNGTLSPGGDGAIGAINITGKYTPGSAGVVKIDVGGAGVGAYDTLSFGGGIVFGNSGSDIYGSLTTNLLGGYAPTVDTTFNVFSVGTTSTGYFRHVDGSILGTGNNRSMLKARYDGTNGAPVLVMKGSEDITYTGTVESQWKYSSNWQGGILPTAIDNVIVNSGGALSHGSYDGTDTVNSLQLASGSSFYLSGGTLNVGNITSSANFNLGGGYLNLTGTATLSSLSMSNGSTFNGVGTGSSINVTNNFAQNGGVIASDGDIALTQVANLDPEVSGNLMVGTITARNLVLQAQGGSIRQNEVTQLHVRQQLTTASSTGTTLTNSGNQIAAYTGANTGVGNIALTNTLNVSDTSVVLLNGITNAAGNVTVDNTGAMATTGSISALNSTLHSTVSLSTHSPLTIGSGGVSADGNILLSAGNSGSATDNLIINGVVTSAGGNINLFAGNSMSVNANISTSAPGQALFNVVNGTVTYAPGVSITDVSGTQIPVAAVVAQVVTPVVTQTIAPAANTVITSTTSPQSTTVTVVAPALSSTSSTNTATETMTTGGDPGTFGGSDTSGSGKSSTSEKTGTKTASKLYCS
ncbi:beta strand repeat-containing protein [Herbaspirillum sp. CF444]|uniref:beta strand repeat-containing protein n=1 Tax=Herbaspirillum sp. CF444 TaxID=1144319 RepID=UPI003FCC4E58